MSSRHLGFSQRNRKRLQPCPHLRAPVDGAYVPREADGFGTGPNWKAYDTIDSTFIAPGVSEGKRNDRVRRVDRRNRW